MNSPDPQPGLDPEEYFDPDMPDSSEQYFSASLEAAGERPRFVLDVPDESAAEFRGEAAESGLTTNSDPSADSSEPAPRGTPMSEELQLDAPERDWRDEVSAKVNSYRSRKPRIERYPSLSLPLQFEVTPLRDETPLRAAADAPAEVRRRVENPEAHAAKELPVTMEATARVLE